MNWINIFQYEIQENVVVNKVMKLEVPLILKNFFDRLGNYRHLKRGSFP